MASAHFPNQMYETSIVTVVAMTRQIKLLIRLLLRLSMPVVCILYSLLCPFRAIFATNLVTPYLSGNRQYEFAFALLLKSWYHASSFQFLGYAFEGVCIAEYYLYCFPLAETIDYICGLYFG